MNKSKYRKVPTDTPGPGSREVMEWSDGVVFMCPCGERQAYVATSPRAFTRSRSTLTAYLTLDPSCGYRAKPDLNRPQNWCHFYIKDGHPEMCDDCAVSWGWP